MKPSQIINQALKAAGILGVGQTALAEDTNDAFTQMNMMLSQWQRKRWLIWHLVTSSFTCTGATSYTIGPAGNFNVAERPDRLESAFVRQMVNTPNPVDYDLTILPSREDYNLIALKTMQSFPQYIFYDTGYPTGNLYPWPVPSGSIYQLHITYKALLSQFTSLTQDIDLPPEYNAALFWNLTQRLRILYRLPPDDQINRMAVDSLNVIRGANTQIPTLRIPTFLVRPGLYNVYSDQMY